MCFYVLEKYLKSLLCLMLSRPVSRMTVLIENFHSITTGRLLKNSVQYTKKLATL